MISIDRRYSNSNHPQLMSRGYNIIRKNHHVHS